MALFDSENNVGQFGADDSNIIRYKQAAEYAEDARQYAIAAADAVVDADNLLNRAEEILQEARDILDDVNDISAEVEELEVRVAAAEAIANEAVAKAQQAIDDTAGIIAAAQGYADAAQASSQAAQGYASDAQTSVADAQGFATQAQGFRDEAEDHEQAAEAAQATATSEADRAKAEADRASEILDDVVTKATVDGFVKVYKNFSDANTDLSERTIGDKVLVWDNDTSIYSWYDVTGTVDSPALTLNTTEKKLKTVNNVQPDDSGNVQITLPSGNPSLWLGETVLFQYDPDQPITYPGLLPQDGSEHNRADYPDLWNAINLGYVPSVSEADWQAGKKNAFSTGDGSTTFRVPLFDGEALRTPNSTDDKGVIYEQIPYVVSVNGVSPDDITGNVQLDLSGYATTADMNTAISSAVTPKANKGVNSDITDLTALSGPLDVKKDGASTTQAVTYQQFVRSSRLEQLMYKMAGGETVKFAAFGDSTTDGTGSTGFTANPTDSSGNAIGQTDHNATAPNAWPNILQSMLREMHNNSNISVWNAGYGGKKLVDDWAINNYDAAITNNPVYGTPDATFVDFGLNDFVTATAGAVADYTTYYTKHKTLISFILAKGTLPILLTSGPTAQNGGDGTNLRDNAQIMRICNEIKFKLAKEFNIPIFDKSSALRDWLDKTNVYNWYVAEPDLLHFGDAGHSTQAGYIATNLFTDIIYASPGCREAVNFMDSRTNSASGGGWFADSNTRFGGNRTYSSTSYTASKVMMRMYVWCTGKDVAAIYRGLDNDGSTVSNSAKISVYEYASKTDIYNKDLPNAGYPESSSIRFSNQAHTLNRLDYGLYRISYIAPPTPVAIYVGHFEFIDGWVPGRLPHWNKNVSRSWRQTNLLKNSGDLVFYNGATGTAATYGVPNEDPDGANVFYWRSSGFQSATIAMTVGLSQNTGMMILSNRGWIPGSPNVAQYDGGLMMFRTTDNRIRLYAARHTSGTTTAFDQLAESAASSVSTDAALNYIVEFIRTSGTGYYISVKLVTDAFLIGTELCRYTVAEGVASSIPSSGVFGGHFVGNNSASSSQNGVRIIRATALYFN